jgi:CBS domain-containing protein
MRVVDVMIRSAISCTDACTAYTAANLLKQVDCGVLPVLEKVSREVIGVITERSLCLRVLALRCDPVTIPAGECVDFEPAVCRPEDTAYAVLAKLAQSHARGAIVVNANNELEGVVSISVLAIRVATAAQELYAALKRVNEQNAYVSRAA